jgi:hypothetical protein
MISCCVRTGFTAGAGLAAGFTPAAPWLAAGFFAANALILSMTALDNAIVIPPGD